MLRNFMTAAMVIGSLAAPATAQYQYQQPVPQPAPGQPGYGYYPPQQGYQQGYGYQQPGYGNDPVGQVINQLLGNRYNVSDRTAIRQCAQASIAQASSQYGNRYNQQGYGYNDRRYNGYNNGANMRVTAITNVERQRSGLRVSGLLDSRGVYPPNGQAYGYQNQGYAATGDLSFRCNVDYRGAVTNVRIRPAGTYRG